MESLSEFVLSITVQLCHKFSDVDKMPLGKLSQVQISKGFACLEELESNIKNAKGKQASEITSRLDKSYKYFNI